MASYSQKLGLAAICLGFLMITLDATIVNVALGSVTADLGGSRAGAQWIVNGYTLPFAALLLTAGALGDRLGARRAFALGLGVFTVASGACAGAGTLGELIAARAIQGAGAAFLMPASLALIAHTFAAGPERRRALSLWGGASGIGLAGGPLLGGVLVGLAGWRSIFLVNVPVAVVAGAMLTQVGETRRHRHPLDPPGQLLGALALGALTGAFILGSAPLLLVGVATAGAFVVVERRVAHPMVDPALFASRAFGVAVTIGAIFNFCLYGALFTLATARGLDALHAGLALLPLTAVVGVSAFASGRFVARFGEWRTLIAGLTCGLLAAAVQWPPALGLVALAMPAMTALALGAAPAERIGLASGVFNASRQAGGALGVAVLGTLGLRAAFTAIALAYVLAVLLALYGKDQR